MVNGVDMFTSLLLPFHCSATFQTWLERSLNRLVKQPFWSSCYAMRQLIVCQAFRLVCVKSIDSTVSIQRFSSKPLIRPLTFNWLTLTSEIHFVKFHPEVASCLLSLGDKNLWKIKNHWKINEKSVKFHWFFSDFWPFIDFSQIFVS